MTRKDYILLAEAVARLADSADKASVVHAIAYALASDNPRFDRDRFLRAAGVAP